MSISLNANTASNQNIPPFKHFDVFVNSILTWTQLEPAIVKENTKTRNFLACKGKEMYSFRDLKRIIDQHKSQY